MDLRKKINEVAQLGVFIRRDGDKVITLACREGSLTKRSELPFDDPEAIGKAVLEGLRYAWEAAEA